MYQSGAEVNRERLAQLSSTDYDAQRSAAAWFRGVLSGAATRRGLGSGDPVHLLTSH